MPKTFKKLEQKGTIEKINDSLEKASHSMREGERKWQYNYNAGSYFMLRAIYHQNEAVIELLKQIQSIKD